MTGKTLAIATGALIAGFGIGLAPAQAQGRLYDRVDVNLPYAVTLGGNTLQPGQYVIRELPANNKQRVLLIYSDNGSQYETMVNTIPAYNNSIPDDTKVTLHHYGPDYYFDKVWIAGRNYGYQFPVPSSVKERQREREGPISVAANYVPPQEQTAQAAPAAPAAPEQTAQAAPPPPPPAPQTAQAAPAPAPAPQTEPAQQENQQLAQNNPPPQQNAEPQQENTANREEPAKNKKLPATSADWVLMLISGGGLSGLGLALRRKR